ncbi:MAG: class I SAM-dependent methyltransferase [Pseudomonadota bacterium]
MPQTHVPLPMRPEGLLGRPFAWLMERLNASTYEFVLNATQVQPNQAVLEIGYGTGAFLRRLAQKAEIGLMAGVDPSPLMHSIASRKLRQTDINFDIRHGDDSDLDWPDEYFDHVVALHSFQFWEAPERTMRRLMKLLKNGGHIWLCLRDHGSHPPEWLPNPISRSGDEISETLDLLKVSGFKEVFRVPTTRKIDLIAAHKA